MTHAARKSAPARQDTVRRHNRALVLAEIAAAPLSRAAVAARTGLARATVSSLVEELLADGLVAESEAARGGRGRPANPLRLNPSGPAGVGVEIGVDDVAACIVDLTGSVRARRRVPSDHRDRTPAVGVARAAGLVARVVADAGLPVAGVSVALPGVVAPGGLLQRAPNLPRWQDVGIADLLADALVPVVGDVPVDVANEADVAALAELWCASDPTRDPAVTDPTRAPSDGPMHDAAARSAHDAAGSKRDAAAGPRRDTAAGPMGGPAAEPMRSNAAGPMRDFVFVSAGVGVGAGIVLGGELFRGAGGRAGELGHVVVDPGGRDCSCGGTGCLETVAGAAALLRATGAPALDDLLAAPGPAVEIAGRALGIALAGAVNLLDVPAVVLGGIYARLGDALATRVAAELATRVMARSVTVRCSTLGPDAALRGAATSVVRELVRRPGAGQSSSAGEALRT